MPIYHAIILGIVQGLTEFLPISSSGHLLLVPWLFEWNDFDDNSVEKAFDVALHIGTLIAVVAYFWRDLTVYERDGVRAVLHRREPITPEGRLAWLLVLSSIPPSSWAGCSVHHRREARHHPSDRRLLDRVRPAARVGRPAVEERPDGHGFGRRDTLLVGAAQVLALNPGTSAPGITSRPAASCPSPATRRPGSAS